MNTQDERIKRMLAAELSKRRREIASGSTSAFAMTYLADRFQLPTSPMHNAMFEALDEASCERGARLVVAAPRGHAKSTCVTLAYGCGSYVARGKSVCELGLIKQEVLEKAIIDEVLRFYRERYQGEGGLERLAQVVREHLGHEEEDVAAARERIEAERARIDENIAALLDNMSAETRELIEERLRELRTERERLKTRSTELERLALRENEVQDMVQELGAFIAGLEVQLVGSVNNVRVAAIRRCVERIDIECAKGISVSVRLLPVAGVQTERIGLHDIVNTALDRATS